MTPNPYRTRADALDGCLSTGRLSASVTSQDTLRTALHFA